MDKVWKGVDSEQVFVLNSWDELLFGVHMFSERSFGVKYLEQ